MTGPLAVSSRRTSAALSTRPFRQPVTVTRSESLGTLGRSSCCAASGVAARRKATASLVTIPLDYARPSGFSSRRSPPRSGSWSGSAAALHFLPLRRVVIHVVSGDEIDAGVDDWGRRHLAVLDDVDILDSLTPPSTLLIPLTHSTLYSPSNTH